MEKNNLSENIELQSFSRNTNTQDIEEYHEISENVDEQIDENIVPNKATNISDYDFFVKNKAKKGEKKKKSRSKPGLMDIINAEIEASMIPVTDTVVTKIDHSVEVRKSFLMKPANLPKYSRLLKSNVKSTISPIFPTVLDNAIRSCDGIPVQYVEPVLFEDLIADNTHRENRENTKFLEIEIKNIKFRHHHDYSLEKVLADCLVEHFIKYENITKSLDDLSKEVRVNRETMENLKKDLLKVGNKKHELRFDQTVRQYTAKLFHSKEKQKEMLKNEKDIKHKILSLWSDIKMIREKNKVTLTPYIIEVKTNVLDDDKYEQEWNDKFDTEFTDMLYKLEFEYVNEYLEYKDAKNEQKLQGVQKKKLVKPKLQIDDDIVRKDVESIVNNLVMREQMSLKIKRDDQTVKLPRENTKAYEFHFEIYVDDIFVCESEHYSNVNDYFSIEFTEAFSIQILSYNEILTMILFENNKRVSRVDMKIKLLINSKFDTVNFVYDRIEEPTSDSVGCGYGIKDIAAANKVRLKSSNIFKDTLYTNCDVQLKINWQQTNETQIETLKTSLEVGNKIKRLINGSEKANVDSIINIISKVYDRDVSNDEHMFNTLNKIINSKVINKCDDNFSIDENSSEYTRFKLLHIRSNGGFNNMASKNIPIHSSQITTEQLECLQRENEKRFDFNYLSEKQVEMEPIEIQRFISAKYIQKLNKNIIRNLNEHLMRKTYKDVVKDLSYLGFRSFFSKPSTDTTVGMSSSCKNQLLLESLNQEQQIQINVMRAFNILDRSPGDVNEDCENIAGKDGYKVRPLRPFVRVSYHGNSSQTCSAIGNHPTWNHTLKIDSKLEPLSTINVSLYDEFKVTVSESHSDVDEQQSRTVLYRYYNRWLGTVQIPVYTVLSLGSLKGIFKISTPPVVFGYETAQNKDTNSLMPDINQLMKKDVSYIVLNLTTSLSKLGGLHNYNLPLEDDYIIKHLNNYTRKYTNDYPNRFIALTYIDSSGKNKCVTQFLQSIPLPPRECFPKNPKTCESALSKSSTFSRSSSSKCSKGRREGVESVDSPSRDWSVDISEAVNACLRYVALIPTYDIADRHVVTLTGSELLKVLYGSPLDHTLLLASYFLHLGIKCWIATGIGLPRGVGTFVLVQYDITLRRYVLTTDQLFKSRGFLNKSDGYVWYVFDAVTGERFELRDVGCPLKTVHFVFDEENIWINTQSSQNIESVTFDLSRSSDWEKVFDNSIFVMKNPAVLNGDLYSTPPNIDALRLSLENKIKNKIQKWRSHMKTIWNRYCSGVLRESLPGWEYWAFNHSESKPGPSQKLKQLMVTYKIFGFPLNMAFVNTKSVISTVKATSLHTNDDPNVEFALAVDVYAYPNNVLSVWVFFGSINRI